MEATGGFKNNPDRKRKDPDTGGELGLPPTDLDEEELRAWIDIVNNAPLNVLRNSDRAIVTLAARIQAHIKIHDLLDISVGMIAQYQKCLAALGMTPADRSRVSATEEKKAGKFAQFQMPKKKNG